MDLNLLPITASRINSDVNDEEDEEHSESLSEINLSIQTPLTVDGDNNLIAIDASTSASKISIAIVLALKQMATGGSGVPMIDEDGRPRPLTVDVLAGTTIRGSNNAVGEKAVVGTISSGGRSGGKKKGTDHSQMGKRERASSEPVEADAKRPRHD